MSTPESRRLTIGLTSGDHLRLEVVEIVPNDQPGAGDFNVSVSVNCSAFTASDLQFWIQCSEFNAFLAAVQRFESLRIGDATLESMSPGDFVLTITSKSPIQEPIVIGKVTGPFLGGCARACRGQLNFAFQLDASLIVQLQSDLENLLSSNRVS